MKKSKSPIRKILIAVGGFFIVLILFAVLGYLYLAYFLPIPDSLTLRPHHLSTKIFDRRGELLYEVLSPGQGRKTYLALDQMPPEFIQAVIVSEDSDFYQHIGIDLGAIARAFFYNSLEKRITSGASTITQQLVRNLMGTNRERSFQEKIIETAYAIRLSHLYSKDQVLEQYLNTVYFGNQAYGAGEAALRYFNKNLADLDLAELTMLAGLPQSPSQFNPLVNLDKAKKRQRYVLDRLAQSNPAQSNPAQPNLGVPAQASTKHDASNPAPSPLTQEEADQAYLEELHFATSRVKIEAPHFVQHLLAELEAKYGEDLLYSGLEIRTTIDLDLQKKAEQIIDYQLSKLSDKHVTNAALLAANNHTGEILVWVGSQDFFNEQIAGQVDLVTALRQPGSALKPFLYLLALENGDNAATIIPDLPLQIKTDTGIYSPLNYDLDFHGPVRIREALANSFNIPAVKTQEEIGTEKFLNFLRRLGLKSLDQTADYYGLALTLGGGEVRLLDLANAYLTLANWGQQKSFVEILEVKDPVNQQILEKYSANPSAYILGSGGKQNAAIIIDILSDANARLKSFGEGNVLELNFPAAAKTGTTRNFKDNWTFGFSNQILTGVWVGNSDASSMENISGIDGAGPIWHEFMEYYHRDPQIRSKADQGFLKPDNLHQMEICAISGLLPTAACQAKILEWFRTGTEPQKLDQFWQTIQCPSEKNKFALVFTDLYKKWADDRQLNPAPNCQILPSESQEEAINDQEVLQPEILINSPLPGDSYQIDQNIPLESQKVTIKGLIRLPNGFPNSQINIFINQKLIQSQAISQNTTSGEFLQKWLPTRGTITLKVELTSSSGQKPLEKSLQFYVQ